MNATVPVPTPAWRNVLRNFLTLLGGRAAGGVLALAATLLSARALGPADFGTVALIQAYTLIIRSVMNVKPFEAVIRYGVPLHDDGDRGGLAQLLRTLALVDIGSALLGALVGVAGAPVMAWCGVWSTEVTPIAMAYSLLLLTSGQGTASGALRVFDRFDAIARTQVVSNGARLVGVALVAWVFTPTVPAIAAVWALAQVLQNVMMLGYGWSVTLSRLGGELLRGRASPRATAARHPGIWSFLHVVYWQSSLDVVPKSLGTVLAGGLLGAEAAALFRIAREFGNVVAKPALLARQAIYPDLARLQHRADRGFGRLTLAVAIVLALPAALATALAAWLGADILCVTVGAEYATAAGLLTWLVGAATVELAAAPLRPAAYTLSRAGASLRVQALAALLYVVLFVLLTPSMGLIGPGVAALTMSLVMLSGTAWVVRAALRRDTRG
ncbi:MAG: lipopolysaccharide biosynthesis protein [Gammaproteobacteria bacterium]